ncbi:hypothetical protein JCM33374_g4656 [Metschnikowia sp. JCM 33374]|nr:hypothetical protein JCM33374_g4656 [Metschnikowia sp. JCM 33374]
MRFSQTALLAVSSLAYAKDFYQWAEGFTSISSTDSAAFTSWRNGYEDSYKSWVKSYIDHHASKDGYDSSQVASLESSLFSFADAERTKDYSYFYSEFNDVQTFYPTDNETYWTVTDDYSDYFTGTETGWESWETGTEDIWETGAYDNYTFPVSFSTIPYTANYTAWNVSAHHHRHHSNHTEKNASVPISASASYSQGSSSSGSSNLSSSYAGMGASQAPFIVGAALAGISILLF